jgi:hypothetical protein
MEEVLHDQPKHVPLWAAAVEGRPNWDAIYSGYRSAVDWPTASFYRELSASYPSAKYVLTVRSPESWVESFSETIYKALAGRDGAPPPMKPWLEMVVGVLRKAGFADGLDAAQLKQAFKAHNDAVKAAIPAHQLLTYQAKDGWEPLCAFLGVPAPSEPFPRTNDRVEFWERIKSGGPKVS